MRTLLIVDAVSFGVFGLAFIFLPDFCARLTTGTAPGTPAALTDVRAIYGGMALGLASFFWLAAAGTAEIGRLGLRVSALAVGFIARPLSGAVFGHLGDKLGRKKMLLLTMFLMGVE